MEPGGGRPKKRVDPEYERKGTYHVSIGLSSPYKGLERGDGEQEHRRKQEFALVMKKLAEDVYPDAERIRLVVDNLRAPTRRPHYSTNSFPPSRRGASLKR
jgi:hypothetical protein